MLFWSGERVLERWKIYPTELASFIYEGLPAYKMEEAKIRQMGPEEIQGFDFNHMTDLLFMPSDIEAFEKAHESLIAAQSDANNIEMTAEEARELGRLKREKAKWDSSIIAAFHIGIYCASLDHRITRDELANEVYKIDPEITDTTIDKIWRSIPEELRKDAGRPRKRE